MTGYHCILFRQLAWADIAPAGWEPSFPCESREFNWYNSYDEVFAIWTVWKRDPGVGDDHGPEAFSLLYSGMDSCTFFQASYLRLNTPPLILALIQVGASSDGSLREMLKEPAKAISSGLPLFLMNGSGVGYFGFHGFKWPDWEEYAKRPAVCRQIGLFRLKLKNVRPHQQSKWNELTTPWQIRKKRKSRGGCAGTHG